MMLLYTHPIFLEHKTGNHPENADRLRAITRQLHTRGIDAQCTRPTWKPASEEQIDRVHDHRYVWSVQEFASSGGGYVDPDTVVSERSFEAAELAAGAVCDAIARIVRGEDRFAFCAVRPPGHHALIDQAMGFCLLNNIAIGARFATSELGLERVLIIDFDVHHGNGTQAIFWEDRDVAYLSMHRYPFYPGTGAACEIGAGAGKGTTMNLPVRFGTPRREMLDRFADSIERFADQIRPQLVLVSAGFDAHKKDPIGSLGLETEDFQRITRDILHIADRHAGGRVISVLEGGYALDALAESAALHLQVFLDHATIR
jgi:acetoin utilization deacetylase AcuC-like enzyme